MTEKEAKEAGYDVRTGMGYFKNSGWAKAIAQMEGAAKIVVNAATDEILGGHILGPHADDLIHEIIVAMQGKGKLDFTKSIHIHPALSEVVKGAAKDAR
ncbi:MAG: hypothetical protein MUO76_16030 [Anaerolineaceae bacterium]|nr:hypothetical protein [Anaerolineaceae bacterium]